MVGGYSVFQMEKSKFVKKKVEETTSFVPGEEKEVVWGGGVGGVFVWLLSGMTYIPVTLVHLTLNVYGRIEFQMTGDSVKQRYEEVDKYSFESWRILQLDIYKIRQSMTQSQTLTLNIPSLAHQRCLPSWGPRSTPWFFCNFSTV
jgi:hypothetical protein